MKLVLLDHVEFGGCDDVWQKADRVRESFAKIEYPIDAIFVEDVAMMYTPGMSSAGTIITLARFNGLVSYLARDRWNVDPVHIKPAEARKICGLKMFQKHKAGGRSHKQQTFDIITKTDLKDHVFPRKKATKKNPNPDVVGWAYDEVDSFVIAKAGSRVVLLNA